MVLRESSCRPTPIVNLRASQHHTHHNLEQCTVVIVGAHTVPPRLQYPRVTYVRTNDTSAQERLRLADSLRDYEQHGTM